jgi:hypothetical protein
MGDSLIRFIMSSEPKKCVRSVQVTEELNERIRKYLYESRTSVSDFLRAAIIDRLDKLGA